MSFNSDVKKILCADLTLKMMYVAQRRLREQERARRRRRYSVHPLWKTRETESELVLIRQMTMDNEEKFYGYFHMSRGCFAILLSKVGAQLTKNLTSFGSPISPEDRLAVCLRYLVTGDSYKTISYSFRMGETTVAEIVKETCRVITRSLMVEVMPFPSKERWQEIRTLFWTKCGFPNCVGAIDGKHITIQAPRNSGSLFFNYKNTFSVVLMALADAEANFIAVDVGAYGRNSDGGVMADCGLGESIYGGRMQTLPDENLPGTSIRAPCVFVGDEAFPLRRNLLRPYPGVKARGHEAKTHFNTRLSMARRVVENAFGILAQKFRIYNRRIQLNPENVDFVVMASCILHNFIRAHEKTSAAGASARQEDTAQVPAWEPCNRRRGGNATNEAFYVREIFNNFLFSIRGRTLE